MTPKERMVSALSLQQPDDFCPVWEIEFHLFNKVASRPLKVSNEYVKLTPAERERALLENAEIMVEVASELGLSALINIGPYWEVAPGVPAAMWLPPADSKAFLPILRKKAGDELFIIEWCPAMIFIPEAGEYLEFAYKLFDAPEEVDEMARRRFEDGLEIARRAAGAGADGLCAACDIADSHGVYFSPSQLQRFFLPYLHSWAIAVRNLGMKSILHTDGNIGSILDVLADSGIDALQAIDPVAGMDIVEVKKQVGDRLCLCGNIDLGLLTHGPEEAIREETKRICLGCKGGGGFVLGATNAVYESIPIEHYRAMLSAGRDYGSYSSPR